MYLEHFGLKRKPFKITPDTSLFYEGNKRGAALGALKYAIESGEGIIKVVGEVGAGKTMLCRMLEVELPDNIEIVYIANPSLSPDNILHVIGYELKLEINDSSSKLEVMHKLQNYLLARHAENKQVVVFVEEAQSMPIETLEEIRLLSNLETNEHKLLQMVLFGQPELDEKLRSQDIRQLNERITHSFYLDPFPKSDIYAYLNFRMRSVGYRGPDIFSQSAASNIEKKSNGLTRRINIIADKALMAAYAEGGHNIKNKHINTAAKDSEFYASRDLNSIKKAAVVVLLVGVSVWLGTLVPGLTGEQGRHAIGYEQINRNIASVKEKQLVETLNNNIVKEEAVVEKTLVNDAESTDRDGRLDEPRTKELEQVAEVAIDNNDAIIESSDKKSVKLTGLSLLTDRLEKTREWLASINQGSYTIQLILLDAGSTYKVNRFIKSAIKVLDQDKIYVYKSVINGLSFYSVLYDEYTTRRTALDVLYELPDELTRNDPYLRNIRDIKSEIGRAEGKETVMNEELN